MRTSRAVLVVVLAAALTSGCIGIETRDINEAILDQKIAQASTPADHTALAAYYDAQASEADHRADARRRARHQYERWPPGLYYPIGTTPSLLDHYDQLIAGYEQTARENPHLG
ncbi:MAG: hypothetical protein ISP90_00100 [Nevskia sp.]|nr:hypothetical protein [Nevskia sp.]